MNTLKRDPAFEIDAEGWLIAAQHHESPNQDARPDGVPIDLLVLHCISLPPGKFSLSVVDDLFLNRLGSHPDRALTAVKDLHVSAHFVIARDGKLVQFVSTLSRAWHAGLSQWQGRARCNDFSVGVELIGSEFEPFTDTQYEVLNDLITAVCNKHPIQALCGHNQIAPGRKFDPGPLFDWSRISPMFAHLRLPS